MSKHICLLLVLFCAVVKAQNSDFKFKHISSANGLSQSSVIAIEQDSKGFMWLGTRDGLNLYDGHDFKVFKPTDDEIPTLSSSDVLSIEAGSNNDLWVGTYNGLNLLNAKNTSVERVYKSNAESSIAGNVIYEVLTVDKLVCVATDRGLSLINGITHEVMESNLFKNPTTVYTLYLREEWLFMGTNRGLFRYNLNSKEFESVAEELQKYSIQAIIGGTGSSLLMGTKSTGLLRWEQADSSIQNIKLDGQNRSSDVRDLIYDDEDRLWIGTYGGVFILEDGQPIIQIKSNLENRNGLKKNSVKSLFRDQSGSIWIGTYNGGAHIWNPSNNKVLNYTESFGNKGLNNSVVSAIQADENFLYIATEQGGLNIMDRSTGTFQYITTANSPLREDNLKALRLDKNLLWIGLQSKGIQVFDVVKNSLDGGLISQELKQSLANTGVYDIYKREDVYYFATFGQGLISYDISSKKLLRLKISIQR